MIKNRKDLKHYLQQDKKALKRTPPTLKTKVKHLFFPDYILRFQRSLRYTEYYHNQKKNPFTILLLIWHYGRYRRLSIKLGFSIPLNVFGPGLSIPHIGTIVVNPKARIGANCRIHVCTNIGASGGSNKAPQMGDNIYIAPGVKIYGDIHICNNVAFAANAAVHKSIVEPNTLHGGVPAKLLGPVDIKKLIKHIS